MSDSGKHRAVESHKNSDGTFELVMKTVDDLPSEAISDSEVEFESSVTMDAVPTTKTGRVLIPVIASLVLLALAVVAYLLFGAEKTKTVEVDVVPGFKPYVAGAVKGGASKEQPVKRTTKEPDVVPDRRREVAPQAVPSPEQVEEPTPEPEEWPVGEDEAESESVNPAAGGARMRPELQKRLQMAPLNAAPVIPRDFAVQNISHIPAIALRRDVEGDEQDVDEMEDEAIGEPLEDDFDEESE